MKRAARAAWWVLPAVFCLALYRFGLKAWFQQDDFAWLGLSLHVHNWRDLASALFEPKAQGTIRPLSERAFFLGFYSLFGLNALPFRIAAFATQIANLVLAGSIAHRLTGSRGAGFLAPVLWTANGALALAMSWTSAYNQILCAFFLLLSFRLLIEHIETGRRSYWTWQWITFLAGFGALEINVVYPALAAAYALCRARPYFRKTLWLFVPSVAFAAAHWHYAPKPTAGRYAMHFDASMLSTLWRYWEMALGPSRMTLARIEPPVWLAAAATALLTLLLLGFAVQRIRRGELLGAFLPAWFVLVIAPVLPLRDHVSDYYLTSPLAGLAMLGAWALIRAWKLSWYWRATAVVGVAVYLASSLPVARAITRWNFERSREVRNLVLGLARVRELHRGKVVLLTGVSADLFWAGIHDKPYRLLGMTDVHLAPGAEKNIEASGETGAPGEFVLPEAFALRALEERRAVVYSAAGPRLRNVTNAYLTVARVRWSKTEEPRRVDVGDPLYAGQLGPGWHRLEGRHRWMGKRATVRLGGPRSPAEKLHLAGFCPVSHLVGGPIRLTVAVDGRRLGTFTVTKRNEEFAFAVPIPPEIAGAPVVEVALEVDRTVRPAGDVRELGLVFGVVAIR